MSKMIIKIVDHDQKVFNMIDYGGDFEFFNDPRCDELMEHCERITSATNRHIEAFPGLFPHFQRILFHPTYCLKAIINQACGCLLAGCETFIAWNRNTR